MFSGRNVLKKQKDGSLRSGSLYINADGDAYSYNQLISKKIGDYVFYNDYKFSSTTSNHQRIVRGRIDQDKIVLIEVSNMGEIFKYMRDYGDFDHIANKISLNQNTAPSENLKAFLSKYSTCLNTLNSRVEKLIENEKKSNKARLIRHNLRHVKYKTVAMFERKFKELLSLDGSIEYIDIHRVSIDDERLAIFAEYFLKKDSESTSFNLGNILAERCKNLIAVKSLASLGD